MQSKSQVSSCDLDNNAEAYHGEKRSPSPTTESDTYSGKRLRPNALEEHTNNRKSSKRKTKPTWKLNGYLQTCKIDTSCNTAIQRKKRKYEKHFLSGVKTFSSHDMSSNESVVTSTAIPPADINGAIGKEIKDDKGTINKESNSQCVKGKTNIDTQERKTLENTKKQACSQPVYVITTDRSEYTYYLLSRTKEPDKSTTENWETVSYYDRMVSYAKQNRKTDKHGKIANKSRKHRKLDVVPEPGKVSYWKSSKAMKIKKVSDTTPADHKSAQELTKLEDHPDSYCLEEFTELAPSARHKPEEEKQCVRYLCKLCGSYRTLVREQLEQHIGYHKSGKLNCKHCQFVADSTYNLRNHITAEHHETGAIFLCEFCGVEMSSWNMYKNHVSKVHGKSIFQCRQCNSMFHNDTEYRHHRLNAHEFSSAFKCDKCKEIYLSETSYDTHRMNGKCDLTLFKCKYCDLVRDSISRIQYHEKMVHSKDSVHKCTICSFSAISKTQLTHHTNAHLGIHPYSCDLCDFSCVKKYQLTSHQRTHSGEKMFKCDKCTYAAAWNVLLKSHLKAHDSETQRVCSQCGIVVKDKRCLKLHENKEHKRN